MTRYEISGTIPVIGIRRHTIIAATPEAAISRFKRAYNGKAIHVDVASETPRLTAASSAPVRIKAASSIDLVALASARRQQASAARKVGMS